MLHPSLLWETNSTNLAARGRFASGPTSRKNRLGLTLALGGSPLREIRDTWSGDAHSGWNNCGFFCPGPFRQRPEDADDETTGIFQIYRLQRSTPFAQNRR